MKSVVKTTRGFLSVFNIKECLMGSPVSVSGSSGMGLPGSEGGREGGREESPTFRLV